MRTDSKTNDRPASGSLRGSHLFQVPQNDGLLQESFSTSAAPDSDIHSLMLDPAMRFSTTALIASFSRSASNCRLMQQNNASKPRVCVDVIASNPTNPCMFRHGVPRHGYVVHEKFRMHRTCRKRQTLLERFAIRLPTLCRAPIVLRSLRYAPRRHSLGLASAIASAPISQSVARPDIPIRDRCRTVRRHASTAELIQQSIPLGTPAETQSCYSCSAPVPRPAAIVRAR